MASDTGEVVGRYRGRCNSPNLCEYCARLASILTAEMLALDAMSYGGPAVWLCLGTRTPTLATAPFYRGREKVWKSIRRRWPDAEATTIREFTTGYGPRSGGKRRPHWNLLVKGVDPGSTEVMRELAASIWCRHVDALPERQYGGTVYESGGLMRYLALHFTKESQAPPKGWKGHRVTQTRGYYGAGVRAARETAQRSLNVKRAAWKLEQRAVGTDDGFLLSLVDELAQAEVEYAESRRWQLVREFAPGGELRSEAMRMRALLRG